MYYKRFGLKIGMLVSRLWYLTTSLTLKEIHYERFGLKIDMQVSRLWCGVNILYNMLNSYINAIIVKHFAIKYAIMAPQL